MIIIQNTIISEDVKEKQFACNLAVCKGICCVLGDAGAPLEEKEIALLEKYFPDYKINMPEDGIKTVETEGYYVLDNDNEYVTPLVAGKHCAYVYFENDIAKCAIEKAYLEGKIPFKKPISCHLYPVRISKYDTIDAVNYHEWEVCKSACELGNKTNMPIYKFLKEPLIRKYGEKWYEVLENYPF